VLATRDPVDGGPYTNLVGFAAPDDLSCLVFGTPRKTSKFRNLTAEPKVSLLVDTWSNSQEDFGSAAAVTAIGAAVELEGERKQAFEKIYTEKLPGLAEFITDPNTALISVAVEKYCLVSNFQQVRTLDMYPGTG